MPPQRKGRKDALQFFVVKSKLKSIIQNESVRQIISSSVLLAHETTKLGLFFFKAFCLECERLSLPVPEPNHSVMIACLDQVCLRCRRGAKCKSTDLLERMSIFRERVFCKIYSEKVDMRGKSMLKALVADQMLVTLLTDIATRFRSRCMKLCLKLGSKDKSIAAKIVYASFTARWEEVPETHASVLKRLLPQCPDKNNTFYDLKTSPSRYFKSTMMLCRELGPELCKFSFCPTRSSCVPCHVKFDTESIAQILLPYKECVEARKIFGKDGRKQFNEWVWNHFVNRKNILSKSRKFTFHDEIVTDGVAVSVLYSRKTEKKLEPQSGGLFSETSSNKYPGRMVGVDPGKKNIVTLTDENGVSLRYTCRQRLFESKVLRYREVLEVEKLRAPGLLEAEQALSRHSRKTNNADEFMAYLKAKKEHDEKTSSFYQQEKWRGWKFRLFCHRRRSEDSFCNRVAYTYGKVCTLYYGNWSRINQIKGCSPSPVIGIRKILSKRFLVKEVDEFRTSKICNACSGELSRYRKKDGKLSYSRLCCTNCKGHPEDNSKRFVDRDLNAALNILLVGTSVERPACLCRPKQNRPFVDASGPSSDPHHSDRDRSGEVFSAEN